MFVMRMKVKFRYKICCGVYFVNNCFVMNDLMIYINEFGVIVNFVKEVGIFSIFWV